jgi:hypothetical protein
VPTPTAAVPGRGVWKPGFSVSGRPDPTVAMPVSWKGTLIQFAGRLHWFHARKTEAAAARG